MKNYLNKKISNIHAIKCNKTLFDHEVQLSKTTLSNLKKQLADSNEADLGEITQAVDNWASSHPIANESEITRLMNGIK